MRTHLTPKGLTYTMSDDTTPTLDTYRRTHAEDPNAWWRLDSGHALNLFNTALDRLEELEGWKTKQVERARRAITEPARFNRVYDPKNPDLAVVIDTALDERDALRTQHNRIREALAGHPTCNVHPDEDPISCGWKRAVADVVQALEDPPPLEYTVDVVNANGTVVNTYDLTEGLPQALLDALDDEDEAAVHHVEPDDEDDNPDPAPALAAAMAQPRSYVRAEDDDTARHLADMTRRQQHKELPYHVMMLSAFDAADNIWWRIGDGKNPDDKELHIYALCNDLFHWGAADVEEITLENLPTLRQAVQDVAEVTGDIEANSDYAFLLFAARVRGMRPQKPFYDTVHARRSRPLPDDDTPEGARINSTLTAARTRMLRIFFDEAGPERT